jgi:3-deoxy-7-phosphoheptulonate synthase
MTTHQPAATAALSTQDSTRIDDTRISAVRPLITPALLQEWLPVPASTLALVEDSRKAISRVLQGADDRLVVVVGPCSIHHHARRSSTPASSRRRPMRCRANCWS